MNELKTPADIDREKRLERMDAVRTATALEFDDAVEEQARKVGYNILTQFGIPKDASSLAYYITLAVTSTVLWAVADGWVELTEKGKADPETAERKALHADAKKAATDNLKHQFSEGPGGAYL